MSAAGMPPPHRQRGFTLIEVLVAVVVFAFGVLGLVKLQGNAIKLATDAQQRADATFLADQLLARMLIADPATAASFAHNPSGSSTCAPDEEPTTNPSALEWLQEVTQTFPRVEAAAQQIIVSGTPANQVTVKLCWKNGESDLPHTLEVTNRVQWQ